MVIENHLLKEEKDLELEVLVEIEDVVVHVLAQVKDPEKIHPNE